MQLTSLAYFALVVLLSTTDVKGNASTSCGGVSFGKPTGTFFVFVNGGQISSKCSGSVEVSATMNENSVQVKSGPSMKTFDIVEGEDTFVITNENGEIHKRRPTDNEKKMMNPTQQPHRFGQFPGKWPFSQNFPQEWFGNTPQPPHENFPQQWFGNNPQPPQQWHGNYPQPPHKTFPQQWHGNYPQSPHENYAPPWNGNNPQESLDDY